MGVWSFRAVRWLGSRGLGFRGQGCKYSHTYGRTYRQTDIHNYYIAYLYIAWHCIAYHTIHQYMDLYRCTSISLSSISTSVYLHMCLSLSLSFCIALFVPSFCLSFLLIPFTYTCILHIYICILTCCRQGSWFLTQVRSEAACFGRDSGFGVGCRVRSSEFCVNGFGFRVLGSGVLVGLGFEV